MAKAPVSTISLRFCAVDRSIDVKVVTLALVHAHPAVAAEIEPRDRTGNARIHLENEQHSIVVEHGHERGEDIGAENTVAFALGFS